MDSVYNNQTVPNKTLYRSENISGWQKGSLKSSTSYFAKMPPIYSRIMKRPMAGGYQLKKSLDDHPILRNESPTAYPEERKDLLQKQQQQQQQQQKQFADEEDSTTGEERNSRNFYIQTEPSSSSVVNNHNSRKKQSPQQSVGLTHKQNELSPEILLGTYNNKNKEESRKLKSLEEELREVTGETNPTSERKKPRLTKNKSSFDFLKSRFGNNHPEDQISKFHPNLPFSKHKSRLFQSQQSPLEFNYKSFKPSTILSDSQSISSISSTQHGLPLPPSSVSNRRYKQQLQQQQEQSQDLSQLSSVTESLPLKEQKLPSSLQQQQQQQQLQNKADQSILEAGNNGDLLQKQQKQINDLQRKISLLREQQDSLQSTVSRHGSDLYFKKIEISSLKSLIKSISTQQNLTQEVTRQKPQYHKQQLQQQSKQLGMNFSSSTKNSDDHKEFGQFYQQKAQSETKEKRSESKSRRIPVIPLKIDLSSFESQDPLLFPKSKSILPYTPTKYTTPTHKYQGNQIGGAFNEFSRYNVQINNDIK